MKRNTRKSEQSTTRYANNKGKAYILMCDGIWWSALEQPDRPFLKGWEICNHLNARIRANG